MKQLKVYSSLDPKNSIGWARDDIPGDRAVHVFAQALPGAMFQPSDGRGGPHWPCEICKAHGYTEVDFREQMLELMRETN